MAISKAQVESVMSSLPQRAFHSEAEFQFAFAWELKLKDPSLKIFLEHTMRSGTNSYHVDLIVEETNGDKTGFEFKYKTKKTGNPSAFGLARELLDQGAQNNACYDYLKDVFRLEDLKNQGLISAGYSIMLTNDDSYCNSVGKSSTAAYTSFRICQGNTSSGTLSWRSTKSGKRSAHIVLKGSYTHSWNDYRPWGPLGNAPFKCLITEVK